MEWGSEHAARAIVWDGSSWSEKEIRSLQGEESEVWSWWSAGVKIFSTLSLRSWSLFPVPASRTATPTPQRTYHHCYFGVSGRFLPFKANPLYLILLEYLFLSTQGMITKTHVQSVFLFKLWRSSNEQGKADAPVSLCSSQGEWIKRLNRWTSEYILYQMLVSTMEECGEKDRSPHW